MRIWMRYSDDGSEWTSERVIYLNLFDKKRVSGRAGETLRSRLYRHVAATRKTYALTITADDAQSKREFLAAWFCSLFQEINLSASGTLPETGWVRVQSDVGDEPLEFLEGVIDLPEYTFNIAAEEPE